MVPPVAQSNSFPVDAGPKGVLVIYGAWYLGRMIAETATLDGWTVAGFVDPDPPNGTTTLTRFPKKDAKAIVAVGNNQTRAFVHQKLLDNGRRLTSVLHPSAIVSPSAIVAEGCYLAEYSVVRTNSHVGAGCVLNSGAVVSHDCRLEQFVTFGPNAASASQVYIGERTLVGVGASIRPSCTIGAGCVIAAGAAVAGDVTEGEIVGGVPARPLKLDAKIVKQSDWKTNKIW